MKKLGLKKQRQLIQLFNNLFASGFTLIEMVDFLSRSQLLEDKYTRLMYDSLLNGANFSELIACLGFSNAIVTQMNLADEHGNTQKSLVKIEHYLTQLASVRKKLIEVATYPFILLSFLVLIMLGLKNYLLPQLDQKNFAAQVINAFPIIFLSSIFILSIVIAILYYFSKKLSRIALFQIVVKIPFIKSCVRLYLTAYYAREWGNLLGQGLELYQILPLMQQQKSALFQEIGQDMEKALLSGRSFHQKILDYPFFLRELSLMIEYGEVKSKLGSELEIYSEEIWEAFFTKLNKASQLIQPLVFVLVALVVVMIYAAMLLPMYSSMEIR